MSLCLRQRDIRMNLTRLKSSCRNVSPLQWKNISGSHQREKCCIAVSSVMALRNRIRIGVFLTAVRLLKKRLGFSAR